MWKHFPVLLALCMGNSPVTGEFLSQRPVMLRFDVQHMNKQLNKQPGCWWFEMPSCSLWHHCNDLLAHQYQAQRWLKSYICFLCSFFGCQQFQLWWYSSGVEVTKAPFNNFSVSKHFDLAKVPVRFFKSHSYLTCVPAAELHCGDNTVVR